MLYDIRHHCCGRRGLHLHVQDYIRRGGSCSSRSFNLPASALRCSCPNFGQRHARCCLWRTQEVALQILGRYDILVVGLRPWLS